MASPIFLSRGHTPTRTDTRWYILQRILGALNDTGGGGAAGVGQIYNYSGASPAFNPDDLNGAAVAYSEDGSGPTFYWNIGAQAWM